MSNDDNTVVFCLSDVLPNDVVRKYSTVKFSKSSLCVSLLKNTVNSLWGEKNRHCYAYDDHANMIKIVTDKDLRSVVKKYADRNIIYLEFEDDYSVVKPSSTTVPVVNPTKVNSNKKAKIFVESKNTSRTKHNPPQKRRRLGRKGKIALQKATNRVRLFNETNKHNFASSSTFNTSKSSPNHPNHNLDESDESLSEGFTVPITKSLPTDTYFSSSLKDEDNRMRYFKRCLDDLSSSENSSDLSSSEDSCSCSSDDDSSDNGTYGNSSDDSDSASSSSSDDDDSDYSDSSSSSSEEMKLEHLDDLYRSWKRQSDSLWKKADDKFSNIDDRNNTSCVIKSKLDFCIQ
jgi:hypothetical protein